MTNPRSDIDLDDSHPSEGHDPLGATTEADEKAANLTTARTLLGAARWSTNLGRPAPPFLIPDLLQARSIHVLSAAKGSCKTWLGLSMMLSGIYGTPVLGLTPTRKFRSIYVAADSPEWDIRGQVRNILNAEGLKPVFPTQADTFLLPYGFKFTNPKHIEAITGLHRSFGSEVLFIDVLLYAHDGLNENDNSDMGRLFELVKFCRDRLKMAVVLLHHHTKPNEFNPAGGARGAGTIIQACEHHYELRRGRDRVVTMRRDKIRGRETWSELKFKLEYISPTAAKLELVVPDVAQPRPPAVAPMPPQPDPDPALLPSRQDHIRRRLRDAGPQTADELAAHLDCSRPTIYRTLSKMLDLATTTDHRYYLPEPPHV